MSGVVITGVGLVSAAGDGPSVLHDALLRGVPLETTATTHGIPARLVPDFDPRRYVARKGLRDLSRTSQLAVAAAAGVAPGLAALAPGDVGVVLGTAWASVETIVTFEYQAYKEGPRFVDPLLFTETVPNVPAGQVAIVFGWAGANLTLGGGSTAGLDALGRAIDLLEEGRARAVVAGGADEVNPALVDSLATDGRIARTAAALPYAGNAAGPVAGEGGCLVVIETAEAAAARGAAPLGHLAAAVSRWFDPAHAGGDPVAPRAALVRTMIATAGLAPGDLDLVVVLGNGDPLRDRIEADVLRAVFAGACPPLVAPKGVLGEPWAAGGPAGVVLALEVMRTGRIPGAPSGFVAPEEFADLPLAAAPRERGVLHALVLDATADGQVAGVVLSAPGAD